MKKILVAIDGSPLADKALERALHECLCSDAELLAVNVVESLSFLSLNPEVYESAKDKLMREPLRILAEAEKKARKAGVAIRTLAEPGRPADVIADIARKERADEIIVGSLGKNAVDNLLLGSVSSRLVQTSPCTVVVVR